MSIRSFNGTRKDGAPVNSAFGDHLVGARIVNPPSQREAAINIRRIPLVGLTQHKE